MLEILCFIHYFQTKKTNVVIRIPPLNPKGPRFEPFLKFFFSSTKKMDENELPLSNYLN